MKLSNLLPYLDLTTNVLIFIEDEGDEAVYKGTVMNIPYYLLEFQLFKRDETDILGVAWDGIDVCKDNSKTNLYIYLKE